MPKGRVEQDVFERFSRYVVKNESGCHEWQSTIQKDGYGRFYYKGKQLPSHRAAYLLFVGPIPSKMCVMHICDNRRCVNINHLKIGTYSDNFQDMVSKNRHVGRRKLSDEQVIEIVRLLAEGKMSDQKIADSVGTSQVTVNRISHGQRRYLAPILNSSIHRKD